MLLSLIVCVGVCGAVVRSVGLYGSTPGLIDPSCSGPCDAGSYGATGGQKYSTCDGPCAAGYICPAGSTSNTTQVCNDRDASVVKRSANSCVHAYFAVHRACGCRRVRSASTVSQGRPAAHSVLRAHSATPQRCQRHCVVASVQLGCMAMWLGRRHRRAPAHVWRAMRAPPAR